MYGGESNELEIIVVWNTDAALPEMLLDLGTAATIVHLRPGSNLGIPGGRNLGLRHASADVVLFLDDDAEVRDDLKDVLEQFDEDPVLGIVALRLVDERGATQARHVPRLGGRSAGRAGPVALFLGGASLHRRAAFEQVGGYADAFVYAMEESDLALRLIDGGWSISYEPGVRVFHPRSTPGRHTGAVERTARNRVWLAHRNLPLPLAVAYVANWTVVTLVRNVRHLETVRAHWRGTIDGLRAPVGPRRPIGWRTAWRLARLGRPPVI